MSAQQSAATSAEASAHNVTQGDAENDLESLLDDLFTPATVGTPVSEQRPLGTAETPQAGGKGGAIAHRAQSPPSVVRTAAVARTEVYVEGNGTAATSSSSSAALPATVLTRDGLNGSAHSSSKAPPAKGAAPEFHFDADLDLEAVVAAGEAEEEMHRERKREEARARLVNESRMRAQAAEAEQRRRRAAAEEAEQRSMAAQMASRSRRSGSKRSRRIPGPAGNLPAIDDLAGELPALSEVMRDGGDEADESAGKKKASSPLPVTEWETQPWLQMLQALNVDAFPLYPDETSVLRFNLARIQREQLTKVQYVVAMIKTITTTDVDGFITLKDPTGEMQGTVHRKVLEDYALDMRVGSVVVLQRVSIFNPSPSTKYLNITPENLVQIFCAEPELAALTQSSTTQRSQSEKEHGDGEEEEKPRRPLVPPDQLNAYLTQTQDSASFGGYPLGRPGGENSPAKPLKQTRLDEHVRTKESPKRSMLARALEASPRKRSPPPGKQWSAAPLKIARSDTTPVAPSAPAPTPAPAPAAQLETELAGLLDGVDDSFFDDVDI